MTLERYPLMLGINCPAIACLLTLVPNAQYNLKGPCACTEAEYIENMIWQDSRPLPTWAEIEEVYTRLVAEWHANSYQRARKIKYPEIEDQLDTLWHDINNGIFGETAKTSAWFSSIREVKDQIPKSNDSNG
jgi:hypothetical protein